MRFHIPVPTSELLTGNFLLCPAIDYFLLGEDSHCWNLVPPDLFICLIWKKKVVSSHLGEGRHGNPKEQIENLAKQLGLVTHACQFSSWKAGVKWLP